MYPSEAADKLMLRFPPGMRQQVKIEAARNGRSMNSEIIFHLRRVYDAPENEKAGEPTTA